MNLKERTYLWYVVLLRVYIGYYLLYQGICKYQRNFPHGDWIGRHIGDLSNIDLYPWYRNFLAEYMVPHAELLGVFARFGALVGLFMLINYYLGPGMARGGAPLAQQQTFIVCLVVIFLSNPGRTLDLDGLFFSGGRGG